MKHKLKSMTIKINLTSVVGQEIGFQNSFKNITSTTVVTIMDKIFETNSSFLVK